MFILDFHMFFFYVHICKDFLVHMHSIICCYEEKNLLNFDIRLCPCNNFDVRPSESKDIVWNTQGMC